MLSRVIQGIDFIEKRHGAMRIFTRRPSESILIGDCISITVVEIRGAQVRIGVKAPPDVNIQRGEIASQLQPGQPRNESSHD